jgi:hypothetical protein
MTGFYRKPIWWGSNLQFTDCLGLLVGFEWRLDIKKGAFFDAPCGFLRRDAGENLLQNIGIFIFKIRIAPVVQFLYFRWLNPLKALGQFFSEQLFAETYFW